MTREEIIKGIQDLISAYDRDARAEEAIAEAFRPYYKACWQDGKLVHYDEALKLRSYVVDSDYHASAHRKNMELLVATLGLIQNGL